MDEIKKVIEELDYNKSEQLVLINDKINFLNISLKNQHIISLLNPYAIYFSDKKPLVAFFDSSKIEDKSTFYKKIWNYQIPIVIILENELVKVYNGYSLNKQQELNIIDEIKLSSLNKFSPFSFWNITSKTFWEKYETCFSEPKLDVSLLENIKYITNYLKKGNCRSFANKLILRLIFIRFLIDRGIDLDFKNLTNNIKESQQEFLKILK